MKNKRIIIRSNRQYWQTGGTGRSELSGHHFTERGKKMRRNGKTTAALLFSLLFAVVVSLTAFTAVVSAENSDKDPLDKKEIYKDVVESGKPIESEEDLFVHGVHADPTTFEKNFCLSVDQKEYTISEIEKVISFYLKPGMSDLEKYYTLAKWANQRVVYDNDFWPAGYNLDYYSHQWDAYGAINEDEKSVCAGIAVFYANICHAAGLPCKFVRLNPKVLDHTITYIPDINEHAYYADITENDFLTSKNACFFADNADLVFSDIVNENAEDGTFEYWAGDDMYLGSDIKECWQNKVSYNKWFKEYALHKDTEKTFKTKYEEKGSGDGTSPRSYQDFDKYPAQPYADRTSDVTGIWFLDDFYMDPADAKAMIEDKMFDEQFLNISGVNENYDYDTPEDLVAAVNDTISIEYFPSLNESGDIIAKADKLNIDSDYTVSCSDSDFDLTNGEAVITIAGTGGTKGYNGSYQIPVKLHSATAKTPPTRINGLVYNGKSQKLIEPGEGEHGTMLYAACKAGAAEPADDAYREAVPTGTNAGSYDVWYKVITADENHRDMPAQKLTIIPDLSEKYSDRPVRIFPENIEDTGAVKLSKTAFAYNGKVQKPSVKATGLKTGTDYKVEWGNPSSKNVGTYVVVIYGKGNYGGTMWANYQIKKAANPMKLKAKTATVKRSKVKKKAQAIKRAKAFTVSKAKGKLFYTLVAAKKGKKSFKTKFKINTKTGNVTVKKDTKKGTYKVKVKVKAAGNSSYKASAWKNVTFTVKVK